MTAQHVLVAGVGNIFLGDDAFGSEVARHLAHEPWPDGVRVVDYGIGGIHLAYDLLEGCDLLVLVDTVSRGGPPGDVYVIEVDDADRDRGLDAHSMDPVAMFASVETLGGTVPRTLLVGCEPASVEEEIELSPAVAGAIEVAAAAVREIVAAEVGPVPTRPGDDTADTVVTSREVV
jgi:hydrogenase maturation protease